MAKEKTQVPSVGRIVLVVLPVHEGAFEELVVRPAIIVRVHEAVAPDKEPVSINAQVFMDANGSAAGDGETHCVWKRSLQYDETGKGAHTWHWPRSAEHRSA